jgi:hypothetical protein
MEPVVSPKGFPIEERMIQMERQTQGNGEPVGRIGIETVDVGKGVDYIGPCNGYDDCIMKGVDNVIHAL